MALSKGFNDDERQTSKGQNIKYVLWNLTTGELGKTMKVFVIDCQPETKLERVVKKITCMAKSNVTTVPIHVCTNSVLREGSVEMTDKFINIVSQLKRAK